MGQRTGAAPLLAPDELLPHLQVLCAAQAAHDRGVAALLARAAQAALQERQHRAQRHLRSRDADMKSDSDKVLDQLWATSQSCIFTSVLVWNSDTCMAHFNLQRDRASNSCKYTPARAAG